MIDINEVVDYKMRHTWPETAKRFGMAIEAIRSRVRRYNKSLYSYNPDDISQQDIDDAVIIFHDKKQVGVDWRKILDVAIETQDLLQAVGDTQRIATVEIKTSRPVAVIYTGDWHLGDGYSDHARWRRDIELIINNPLLKMVDLGDDRQNARAFNNLSVVLGQVIQPQLQAQMMRGIVDELTDTDTLISKVDGNHDVEFDERIFGEALQSYLCQRMKAPRFVNRGLLKLIVGEQTYTNLLFHKSRFRSFLRSVHGAYREYQLSFPADVVAGGHDHQPGFEIHHHYTIARESGFDFGGESYLMKVGTYQDSAFGWKYFHNGGFPYNIGIIYWPDKHKKLMLPSIEDTIDYLEKL